MKMINLPKQMGMQEISVWQILSYFSILIPIITFVASLATLVILALGGHFVITGNMSLGDIAAFNSYVGNSYFLFSDYYDWIYDWSYFQIISIL